MCADDLNQDSPLEMCHWLVSLVQVVYFKADLLTDAYMQF